MRIKWKPYAVECPAVRLRAGGCVVLCCVIAAADPVSLRLRQISLISRVRGVCFKSCCLSKSPSDECS